MISFLAGKIINKGKSFVIIKVNDVGYKVHVTPTVFAQLNLNQPVEFYTHQYVREDALELYGFMSIEELEMFELLLSISGIGPKSALGVLCIGDITDLKATIARGDPSLLVKVSGIGKKTAERVVLELRDKVSSLYHFTENGQSGITINGEEIDVLMALGYSLQQAREALKKVSPSVKDSGERIREALKNLGK